AATCVIRFSVDVLGAPGKDSSAEPGLQTNMLGTTVATSSGALSASGFGTDVATISRATPSLATLATPSVQLGGQLSDSVIVSSRVNPQPGATIDFRLYGPDDVDCSRPPVFQSLDVPYPMGGGAVSSTPFIPTAPGTYRWRAFFSGDHNNDPVAGGCNAAGEQTTVTTPLPPQAEKPPAKPKKPRSEKAGPSVLSYRFFRCAKPEPPFTGRTRHAGRAKDGRAAIKASDSNGTCAGKTFEVKVTGRKIERVRFLIDGKVVTVDARAPFSLRVDTRGFRVGSHQLKAKVSFSR
ncbi:MAG: Ig-like domain-containing protein, partial [Solirubrobacterales bacterium]|nr:Ig-like domain-containing protein [Solirubrobacterales bacterium]